MPADSLKTVEASEPGSHGIEGREERFLAAAMSAKDAIRAAESVLFNRLSGKWSSADQAADRCLTIGRSEERRVGKECRSRGAAGNPRVPRLLPGTLGNFPGCL